MQKPQAWLLAEGTRLHLQHGPIDLIIQALGARSQVDKAFRQATLAFQSVLDTLVSQLSLLRRPLPVVEADRHAASLSGCNDFYGDVAQRMYCSASRCASRNLTPMAAVAGAVADHILQAATANCQLQRIMVNNGGDIAISLSEGAACRVGICRDVASSAHPDIVTLKHSDKVGGVATSGWQGRSHSLGIADAVTVLAGDAASADVAATLIANEVDLPGSAAIQRMPASSLSPDSDLQDRLVTCDVASLHDHQKEKALHRGFAYAQQLCGNGLIHSAYLHLQGMSVVAGQVLLTNQSGNRS